MEPGDTGGERAEAGEGKDDYEEEGGAGQRCERSRCLLPFNE